MFFCVGFSPRSMGRKVIMVVARPDAAYALGMTFICYPPLKERDSVKVEQFLVVSRSCEEGSVA